MLSSIWKARKIPLGRSNSVKSHPSSTESLPHTPFIPAEILIAIFVQVPKRTLCVLSRVNRWFNHVATPILYQSVRLGWFRVSPDPPLVLRTIIQTVDIAQAIRSFDIMMSIDSDDATLVWQALAEMSGLRELRLAFNYSGVNLAPHFIAFLQERTSSTDRNEVTHAMLPLIERLHVQKWAVAEALLPGRPITKLCVQDELNGEKMDQYANILSQSTSPLEALQLKIRFSSETAARASLPTLFSIIPNVQWLNLGLNFPYHSLPSLYSVLPRPVDHAPLLACLNHLELKFPHRGNVADIDRRFNDIDTLTKAFPALRHLTLYSTLWKQEKGVWTPQPIPSTLKWWLRLFGHDTMKEINERWPKALDGLNIRSHEDLEVASRISH